MSSFTVQSTQHYIDGYPSSCYTEFGTCNAYGTCIFINMTASSLTSGAPDTSHWTCQCDMPWGGESCTQTITLWPLYRTFTALYGLSVIYGVCRLIHISKMPATVTPTHAAFAVNKDGLNGNQLATGVNASIVTAMKPKWTVGPCRTPWKYINGRGSSGITQWMSLLLATLMSILCTWFTANLYTETPVNASDVAIVEGLGMYLGCYSAALMARRLILPQAALHPPTRAWLRVFDIMIVVLVIIAVAAFPASVLLPPSLSLFKWTAAVHLLVVMFGIARSLRILGTLKATTVTPAQWRVLRSTITLFRFALAEAILLVLVSGSYSFTDMHYQAFAYPIQLFLVCTGAIQLQWVMSRSRESSSNTNAMLVTSRNGGSHHGPTSRHGHPWQMGMYTNNGNNTTAIPATPLGGMSFGRHEPLGSPKESHLQSHNSSATTTATAGNGGAAVSILAPLPPPVTTVNSNGGMSRPSSSFANIRATSGSPLLTTATSNGPTSLGSPTNGNGPTFGNGLGHQRASFARGYSLGSNAATSMGSNGNGNATASSSALPSSYHTPLPSKLPSPVFTQHQQPMLYPPRHASP